MSKQKLSGTKEEACSFSHLCQKLRRRGQKLLVASKYKAQNNGPIVEANEICLCNHRKMTNVLDSNIDIMNKNYCSKNERLKSRRDSKLCRKTRTNGMTPHKTQDTCIYSQKKNKSVRNLRNIEKIDSSLQTSPMRLSSSLMQKVDLLLNTQSKPGQDNKSFITKLLSLKKDNCSTLSEQDKSRTNRKELNSNLESKQYSSIGNNSSIKTNEFSKTTVILPSIKQEQYSLQEYAIKSEQNVLKNDKSCVTPVIKSPKTEKSPLICKEMNTQSMKNSKNCSNNIDTGCESNCYSKKSCFDVMNLMQLQYEAKLLCEQAIEIAKKYNYQFYVFDNQEIINNIWKEWRDANDQLISRKKEIDVLKDEIRLMECKVRHLLQDIEDEEDIHGTQKSC